MKKSELPFKISIAKPCPARWEDMGGNEQVRFCDHCRKNVYNLSAMSAADAAALLETRNGQLCARIYQRRDGTVLTEDCPVGVAQFWRRIKTLVASAVATFLLTFSGIAAYARGEARFWAMTKNELGKVAGSCGVKLPRQGLMGRIQAVPLIKPNSIILPGPAQVLMGDVVAITPQKSTSVFPAQK